MNATFPFGFPAPTALYLTLYVVTLALHVLFMSYTLAGSCFLALSSLAGARHAPTALGSVRYAIHDWLPFALGLAITAGVAPLLFLQVLYEHRFYSANLLLFHRWMLIVPALVTGFYLLYLLKSEYARARPRLWTLSALGAFACFAFTAWSWTENHLLSRDAHVWVDVYASRAWIYRSPETLPRLSMWFCGSLSLLAMALAWQLRAARARGRDVGAREIVLCARLGLIGLVGGGLAAAWYATAMPPEARAAAHGVLAKPWLLATVAGGVLQLYAWLRELRRPALTLRDTVILSVGAAAALLGSGVVRESARLGAFDISQLYEQHAAAAEAGGMGWFFAFLLVNGVAVAFAVRLGRRASFAPAEVE
jgi:hypothetical protein